jgi:hypothetical protein
MIDRVTISPDAGTAPELADLIAKEGYPFSATFFVNLQGFPRDDSIDLEFELVSPDGSRRALGATQVSPGGDLRAVNISGAITLPLRESGIHYLDCRAGDAIVVRVPLQVFIEAPQSTVELV